MSSRSEYNGQQGERPTLPPIRHLLRELDTPHDSPSMTLARLRVSDEDRRSYLTGSSFRGQYATSRHSVPQDHLRNSSTHQHYNTLQYNHNNSPPPPFQAHSTELEDGYTPHVQPSVTYSINRRDPYLAHSSMNANTRSYISQPWTPPHHHHLNTTIKHSREPDASRVMTAVNPLTGHRPMSATNVRKYSSGYPSGPQDLYTNIPSSRGTEDEQTPVARHHNSDPQSMVHSQLALDDNSGVGPMKYECSYCGKGFNRPSSLKIHLNSHTGEKPFVCPVESCGRSFSVLSNMRRHARVHMQSSIKPSGPASDDESEQSSSNTASRHLSSSLGGSSSRAINTDTLPEKWHHRRASSISTSSTSSKNSSEDELEHYNNRQEKRTRHHPK